MGPISGTSRLRIIEGTRGLTVAYCPSGRAIWGLGPGVSVVRFRRGLVPVPVTVMTGNGETRISEASRHWRELELRSVLGVLCVGGLQIRQSCSVLSRQTASCPEKLTSVFIFCEREKRSASTVILSKLVVQACIGRQSIDRSVCGFTSRTSVHASHSRITFTTSFSCYGSRKLPSPS